MSLSMYDASIPVFVRALRNLDRVLAKGEAHARDKGVEPEVLLQSRLRTGSRRIICRAG